MRPVHLAAICAAIALALTGCGYGDQPNAGSNGAPPAPPRVAAGPENAPDQPASRPEPEPPPDNRSAQPEPRPDQPKPPNPDDVPKDVLYHPPEPGIITEYIGGALGAARRAAVMTELKSAHDWLKVYEMTHGSYPENMAAFLKEYKRDGGRLRQAPAHYKYFYWPKQGQLRVVRITDKRFFDPTGLHTIDRAP